MAIRSTQSTTLRPEGVRILDAPLVEINLKQLGDIIRDEKTWETGDKNAITVYKTEGMRIVLIAMRNGTSMPSHKAEGIISVQVLRGSIKFTTDDRAVELSEGKMVTLHKGLYHRVEALENCLFLLTIAGQ